MKKAVSCFLSLCFAIASLALTLPAPALADTLTDFDLTLTYTDTNVNNGIVDNADTAILSKVTKDGMSVQKVVPNPTGTSASSAVMIDHYSYESRELDIESLKKIRLYCYFDGNAALSKASLRVLRGSTQALTTAVTVNSIETIRQGQWQWLTFDLATALAGKTVAGTVLSQFHFMPYGSGAASGLSANDVVYIAKINLSSTAPETGDFRILFVPGRPDVTGECPADTYVNYGSTFTIPTGTYYSRPGYTFVNYVCSADTNTYAPGASYTVPSAAKSGTGRQGAPQTIYFIPTFKQAAADPYEDCRAIKSVDYTDWFSSASFDGAARATVTKGATFDGRRVLKVMPVTNGSVSAPLKLDSWSWLDLPFNLDYYKYATVEYYFETTNNNLSAYKPQLRLLSNGGAVPTTQYKSANETVTANKWAVLTFDLSSVTLNPNIETGKHVIKQIHFAWQADSASVSSFAPGSAIYIGKFTLYHELPPARPQLVEKYMDGDPDGSFRPHDKLTKAEAAKLVHNVLKAYSLYALPTNAVSPFSDVTDTSLWYYESVASLAALGILPEADVFSPSAPVTRKEFAVYVQNAMFLLNTSSVAGTSLFGTGETLSREEAVTILNRLVFGEMFWDLPDTMTDARVTKFDDVDPSIWSYVDIVAATSRRISSVKDGVETPLVLLTDTVDPEDETESFDLAAGAAKIAEIDTLTASRIAEIRATPNTVDPSAVTTGTVYYLSSSSGSTYNAGTSASAPRRISSLGSVNTKVGSATIKAGDVLLFKRGDTFRGQLDTVAGVTYSSYGEGAKPVFIRNTETSVASTSRWSSAYTNPTTGAKIWKYSRTGLSDIGGIALMKNDGSIVVAYKEIPSYKDNTWWVRGKVDTVAFDYTAELDRDLEFVHLNTPGTTTGTLYLRCDAGNPGSVFSNIEFNLAGHLITAKSRVTVDNICMKFFGAHGVSAASTTGLTVSNCEIGWGGGAIQYYSSAGAVTRYGNGIEIYGGLFDFTVDNCYIYQIYDAGATHQIGTESGNYIMENVNYINNVMEYSTYNIEYFLAADKDSSTTERFMRNVKIDNNILRKAGYGWGAQRYSHEPSNIKGWGHQNKAINFTVTNNVIDRSYNKNKGNGTNDWLVQLGANTVGCEPYMAGNTFIQVPGRLFALLAKTTYTYDSALPSTSAKYGAADNAYYFCAEGAEEEDLDTVYRGTIG